MPAAQQYPVEGTVRRSDSGSDLGRPMVAAQGGEEDNSNYCVGVIFSWQCILTQDIDVETTVPLKCL